MDEVERVLLHTYATSSKAAAAAAAGESASLAAEIRAGTDVMVRATRARLARRWRRRARPRSSANAHAALPRCPHPTQVEAVLDAHVRPGDKFEVYCLMELFALSGDLRTDVEALIVRRSAQ